MFAYKMQLTFAQPSGIAPTNFSKRKGDLVAAANKFNDYHKDAKQIELINIDEMILLILKSSEPINNPIKEIGVFSQILKHNFQWHRFSLVEYRLFNITYEEITSSAEEEEKEVSLEINTPESIALTDFLNPIEEFSNIRIILDMSSEKELKTVCNHLALLLELAEAKLTLIHANSLLRKQ